MFSIVPLLVFDITVDQGMLEISRALVANKVPPRRRLLGEVGRPTVSAYDFLVVNWTSGSPLLVCGNIHAL